MKILICGKGGCGKSTLSSLLAKELAKMGKRVLIIDTDESNFGIHLKLGMAKPQDFMNYFGGKKVLFDKMKRLRRNWKLDDIPTSYISEKGNIKLMSMGKIYEFGEGCACPINALSSKFLELLELKDNEVLIADTDAGIEHFGRGVEKGCDLLLTIVDPTHESIMLAEKVSIFGQQIEKPVFYILNRTDKWIETELVKSVDKNRIAAVIPNDNRIFKSNLKGNELNLNLPGIRTLANFVISKF